MATRGVTRPMAQQEAEREASEGEDMLVAHHRQTLWIPWLLILLGVWLVAAPTTFGYGEEAWWARPSGGRGVWFADRATHDSLRASLITWSDVVSGGLLVVLGWRALRPGRPVARWAACLVGVWLIFAPMVLWAPNAAAYLNDSLVGLLVIALTILIPGMPNMVRFMEMGPATPPGWSYNPSTWPQRAILIGLGFAGLVVSRYQAVYQLGYVDGVWDPFFGFEDSTRMVLDSELSHTWPISDAALGTAAYSFEFLMGFMGGTSRWRTMPWMVTMFGILVIPLGLAHIALVMSQPVVVHQWCTMCLLAAALMLPMVTLTVDEVVAMSQHVRDAVRRGDRGGSAWKVFWMGGTAEDATDQDRNPGIADLPERPAAVIRSSLRGATAPWPLVATTALGLLLLAAPALFDVSIRSGAADIAHIGGAFVVVVSVIALAEVVRSVRVLNVAAAVVMVLVLPVTGPDVGYAAAVAVTAVAVAALSLPRGRILDTYGRWDRLIR